jgi:hypothetical protein
MHATGRSPETISDLKTWSGTVSRETPAKSVMNWHLNESGPGIDRQTSRSICDGVAEALQQSLRPDSSRLSPRLQSLMDELRRRDGLELMHGL